MSNLQSDGFANAKGERSISDPAIPTSNIVEKRQTKSFCNWDTLLNKPQSQQRRQAWLILSLVANLGILGFFKYYNFFTDSAANLLTFLGLPISLKTLNIILPAGISFYTFQTLSYSLDVYLGKLKPVRNLWDFSLFVTFFPQLVAGLSSVHLPFYPNC